MKFSLFPLSKTPRRPFGRARLKLLLPLCAASCAWGAVMLVAPAVAAPAAVAGDYKLGVGDELQVTVSNHPDVDSAVVVRPDGKITVPRAGDVVASGKTAASLAGEIQRLLARTLNNARVQVIVRAAAAKQARIVGAVKAPGAYTLKPGWRVMDVVSLAGGLSTKPARISGRIVRSDGVVPFDVVAAQAQPGSTANLTLRPDDLIMLDAQDYTKKLTVTGSVNTPGNYDYDEGLTVTGLLAQAGGPKSAAALRKAYVVRDDQSIPLDLSDIASGNVSATSPLNNFRFQLGDVLTIPENRDRFSVMGEVAKPSYYAFPENDAQATVLNALSMAGGPATSADLSNVSLTRTVNGESTTTTVNARAIMEGTAPDNVRLQPDDMLFVPKQVAAVSVIGPVARPGSYPLQENETLLSLLAKTGSPSKDAGLRKAYVLRDGTQMPIDLRPALVEGAIDPNVAGFQMQNGDVVVIPDISDQVTVSGSIARPGTYNLSDNLSIVSLLAQAGNSTDGAALSKAYVLRQGIKIPLDLNVFLSGTKDQPSLTGFRLKPGDTLFIPQNEVIYTVFGQVTKPGNYSYPDSPRDATILRALSRAGGPAARTGEGGPDLKNAGIIREINGEARFVPVDLNNVLKGNENANNYVLQPDDILFIPTKGRGFRLADILGPALALRSFSR